MTIPKDQVSTAGPGLLDPPRGEVEAGASASRPLQDVRSVPAPRIATVGGKDSTRPAQIVQWLIIAGAWVLFLYWWSVVIQREGTASLLHVAQTLGAGILVIWILARLWVRHNLRIARAGRRGRASFYQPIHFEQDFLGRPLQLPARERLDQAAHIVVEICEGTKRYRIDAGEETK